MKNTATIESSVEIGYAKGIKISFNDGRIEQLIFEVVEDFAVTTGKGKRPTPNSFWKRLARIADITTMAGILF